MTKTTITDYENHFAAARVVGGKFHHASVGNQNVSNSNQIYFSSFIEFEAFVKNCQEILDAVMCRAEK